jgi:hypothetical protein
MSWPGVGNLLTSAPALARINSTVVFEIAGTEAMMATASSRGRSGMATWLVSVVIERSRKSK